MIGVSWNEQKSDKIKINKQYGAFLLEGFRGLEQKEPSWYDAGCQSARIDP